MSLKIIVEGSRTPIYRRIICGLVDSLKRRQLEIICAEPGTETPVEFAKSLNALNPDLVIIPNMYGLLSVYSPEEQKYMFELLDSPVVFVHYDNYLGPINHRDEIIRRLNALISMSGKSTHFCIEDNHVTDIQRLPAGCAHKIYHASEFERIANDGKYRYDVSFVGHLMPESLLLERVDTSHPFMEKVLAAYWKRLGSLDYRIEEDAITFADQCIPSRRPIVDWLTVKQSYRANINRASVYLRGRIISELADDFDIDVIGGDPSYLNNMPSIRQLEHAGVRLHVPNRNHEGTDMIYSESRININITATQFDHAIVNRVLDVAAVGGFLLTDWKADLKNISSVCELISYRTIDELRKKIEYYLTHEKERLEIADQLHRDVMDKYDYDHAVGSILDVVTDDL